MPAPEIVQKGVEGVQLFPERKDPSAKEDLPEVEIFAA
jgi:hypothetical protein